MPCNVVYRIGQRFTRSTITGVIVEEDLDGMLAQLSQQYASKPFRSLLVDTRQAESKLTTTSLFNVALSLQDTVLPGTRVAQLVKKGLLNNADFMETASQNRGILLRYYEDEEDAIAWLTDDS